MTNNQKKGGSYRKIILTFIIAIFIPSIVIGYFSFKVVSERRQSVNRLLESTLWISGENALNKIEQILLDYETSVLKSDNYRILTDDTKGVKYNSNWRFQSEKYRGRLFLIDKNFHIISPQTGFEKSPVSSYSNMEPVNYNQGWMRNAENSEFVEKDYTQAIDQYLKAQSVAVTQFQKVKATGGLGRCLIASKRFEEARDVYQELSNKFGNINNEAGHPYGIISELQLYKLATQEGYDKKGLNRLLDLYKEIRNGKWLLPSKSYIFFIAEIESIFIGIGDIEGSEDVLDSYNYLQTQSSVYKSILEFTELLEYVIIPRITDKTDRHTFRAETVPERYHILSGETPVLISYTILPDFIKGQTYYGGFCWDLDFMRQVTIPHILDSLMLESDLVFNNINNFELPLDYNNEESISKGSLAIAYRQFPFPWKLIITHPEIADFKKGAIWENFYYGALIALLVSIMIFGAVLIFRDISRESETMRMRTEFVHNISHELKTPLTLIRLFSETLQRKKDISKEEIRDSSTIITKESERLSHLIDNVLDFSRIEMGKKEFNFTEVSLSKVVENTLESYRYHLKKKGFTVQKEIATDLPAIPVDAEALASVLINLLSNALKFSPDRKEVIIRLFRKNESIVLQVADKGVGIPKAEIARIFQRFYRVKNNQDLVSKGSGLGLALVKYIIEAHSGWIQVESEPGEGSVFSIHLPLKEP
ncbi:MAG: hypothetical protein HQ562_09240 [Candidatus Marinimicrobia bacterium]|nr:hypothetical protein [Candidatus Neomarinimicrobiota bacterium]